MTGFRGGRWKALPPLSLNRVFREVMFVNHQLPGSPLESDVTAQMNVRGRASLTN